MNLLQLVLTLLIFNLETFGNGPVMVPLLQQELVVNRHVLSLDQLLYAYTIARVTPGQANLYVAAIGYMLFGIMGAVLSIVAIIIPSYVMIPLLHGYEKFKNIEIINNFIKGLTVTSIGLIFAATYQIGQSTLNNFIAFTVCVITIIMITFLKLNTILSLILASIVGILLKILIL